MSSYQEVVEELLKTIGKSSTQEASEIKKWCRSYWEFLYGRRKEYFDFIAEVFKKEKFWEIPQPSAGDQSIKLNRKKVIEILTDPEYIANNKKNPLHYEDRYKISCWGCSEDSVKRIFREKLGRYQVYDGEESYKEKLRNHVGSTSSTPLLRFWRHFIYKDHPLIGEWVKNEFSGDEYSQFRDLANKYKNLGEDKYFAIGFEYAAEEGKEDAMEFFIKKIPENSRKEMLFNTVLEQNANLVAINFCLDRLGSDNHEDLLMASYDEKFKHYSRILNNLVSKHCFEEALNLLKSWGSIVSKKMKENKPEQLSKEFYLAADFLYDDYSSFIYGMLDEMTMPKHTALFEETDNFVYKMLSEPDLESYKNLFIKNTSQKQFTPCRDKMATLLRRDRESKAVYLILESANEEQRKSIISSAEFSLLPHFFSDLKPEMREKLELYGMTEPDYNKSTESLEQSMSASTIESEKGSPTASHSSRESPFSSNIRPVKSEDAFDN